MPAKRIPNRNIEVYAKSALNRCIQRLFDMKELKKFLPLGARHASIEDIVVDLTVCSGVKMAEINKQFRGKNKSTDVLSFPASEFFWIQGVLGDLVLCREVLVKQARAHRHSWKKEVDVLVVHGLLHLLGFDHEVGAKQARAMAKVEAKILGAAVKQASAKKLSAKKLPAKKTAIKKTARKKVLPSKNKVQGLIQRSR